MKWQIITAIIVGLLILSAVTMTALTMAGEKTKTGCNGCNGKCSSENSCGKEGCSAQKTGTCNCGK